MTKTITVTSKHIEQGRACRADVCPVTLAILEHVKPNIKVSTTRNVIDFYDMDENGIIRFFVAVKTPTIVKLFIDNFDHDKLVRAIEFQLDIPDDYIKESA